MKTKQEHSFYEIFRNLCFIILIIGLCLNFISFIKIYRDKNTYTKKVVATVSSAADIDIYKTDTEIYYLPTYETKYDGKTLKFQKSGYQKSIPKMGDKATFKINPTNPEDYDKYDINREYNLIGTLLIIASINGMLIVRKYRRD